jgi:Predicted NTPase (NACHT family)
VKKESTPNYLLRKARIERGWTQEDVAHKLNIDAQTISTWERGSRLPSLRSRTQLCELFEKSLEELGLQQQDDKHESQPIAPSSPQIMYTSPNTVNEKKHESQHLRPNSYAPQYNQTTGVGPDMLEILHNLPLHSHINRREQKNRQQMLKSVYTRWITGYLHHALIYPHPIHLHFVEQPEAVANPWRSAMQEIDFLSRSISEETSITNLFDASNSLLLLGEPGSGKTILLLELTHHLIERAQSDLEHPLPIVFNLSSWAEKQLPLSEWLVEELNTKYHIPRHIGHNWVQDDQLVLLLDGLDEVSITDRASCVDEINNYRKVHGLVPIVICCRTRDYFTLPTRLLVENAITIQPLNAQQIDSYIAQGSEQVLEMRQRLHDDTTLQELSSTPLMLSILLSIFVDIAQTEIQATTSSTALRQSIIETYVTRLLQRRGKEQRYTHQQTIMWLAWLARQLQRHNQTEFYIERMQPDWISDESMYHRYRHTIIRLVYGIESALIAGMFGLLRGGRVGNESGIGVGFLSWLGSGPGNTILGWMAPGMGGGLEGGGLFGLVLGIVVIILILLIGNSVTQSTQETTTWPWTRHSIKQGVLNGCKGVLIVGGLSILLFAKQGNLMNGISHGISYGVFSGLIIGLMSGLATGFHTHARLLNDDKPHPKEKMRDRFRNGLAIGLCAWISFTLANSVFVGILQGLIYGLVIGLLFLAASGFGGATELIPQLGRDIRPVEMVEWSWENTKVISNIQKGLAIGLSTFPGIFLIFVCTSGIFYNIRYGAIYGVVYGLIVGLIVSVASTLAGILNNGWSSQMLAEDQLFQPNEGIHRSLRNSLFAGYFFGPIGGLASGAVVGLAFGLVGGLPDWHILSFGFAIVFTIIFILNLALMRGGIACIEHYILRWYLQKEGGIAWNYIHFLDYASERILLRKIGGGYMFIHRLILDYFANLSPDDSTTFPSQNQMNQMPLPQKQRIK